MLRSGRELWISLIAVILITILYLGVVVFTGSIPAAREFFGHSLGIIGFGLMILTETLYSIRKRSRRARWGRMASWLQFHIFTGLVGPYMVLLHSSWKFNGLAGVVMLLTVIIVASGFVGRYIYTAVPRSVDGAVIQADQLQAQIAASEAALRQWETSHPGSAGFMSALVQSVPGRENELMLIFGRAAEDALLRYRTWRQSMSMNPAGRAQAAQLSGLLRRRRVLERQLKSLAMSRRLLAIWHTVHIPLGMAMFISAIVHIVGAVYYASFL